jgi:hypothetical protein
MEKMFSKVKIGEKFHAGKGAKYMIYEKINGRHGRCCEVVGLAERNIGGRFRFGPATRVWLIPVTDNK